MKTWTRRALLATGSASIAGLSGALLQRKSFSSINQPARSRVSLQQTTTAVTPNGQSDRDILVFLFLRGGCDGLNLVAPVDDPHYIDARPPSLRLTERGEYAGMRLKNPPVDADFRLHASAPELKDLYDDGHLALIHACGLTHGTRSHFEAQELMEWGTADTQRMKQGWIARYLNANQPTGLLPVVAISDGIPTTLRGYADAVAMPALEEFVTPIDEPYEAILQSFYTGGDDPVRQAGALTLSTLSTVQQNLDVQAEVSRLRAKNASYPEEEGYELGRTLQSIAHLIRLDVGLQVVTVDYGDWDTHVEQPYLFTELVRGLSQALGAFYDDLSNYRDRLTVVVMSEFGRRLKANESHGTDHGFGNVAMVLGGNVNGGKIYGQWPGLANAQLDDGADLAITTDYRSILSEVVVNRLKYPQWQTVFPRFETYSPLGLFT